jgi:O-antigen ligase
VGACFAAAFAAAAAALFALSRNPIVGLALIGIPLVIVWIFLPRRADAAPRWFVLFIWLFGFGDVLPYAVGFCLQLVALVSGVVLWVSAPARSRRGGTVFAWGCAILLYWGLAAALHPNVPDLETGLLGFRKSVLAVGGLLLGCALMEKQSAHAERTVIRTMAAVVAVSVVSHLWFPSLEQSISRDADQYTALFNGEPRLQGILAGPFHASIAGVMLFLWGLLNFRSGTGAMWLRVASVVLGLSAVYLSEVRSGYVAIAIALLIWVLIAKSGPAFALRSSAMILLGIVVWFAVRAGSVENAALESLGNYSTDSRFLNRMSGYKQSLQLFERSPVFGWGPGSAGDTLGPTFAGHEHVTPHNLVLHILVEGGIIGLFLFLGLAVAWWQSSSIRTRQGQVAVVLVSALLGFGVTGSAIDTIPVSYFMLILAGTAVGTRKEPEGAVEPKPLEGQFSAASSIN